MASNLLASDDNNTDFVGAKNPDSALWVEFYNKPVKNEFKSNFENRPVFEDRVFVRIQPPGRTDLRIEVEADEGHKRRFPQHWAYYQNTHGKDPMIQGTPLEQWPLLTPAIVESLKAQNFKTVEMVAMAGDEAINRIGMTAGMQPIAFREKARRFLSVAKDSAEMERQAEELKKRDDEIATLKEQMAALLAAQTQEVQEQVKKRPGRPPKVKEAA